MDQPLFTIATVTYNSARWIRQSIESILASSFKEFEYIISDDFSSDDTWDIINEYKDSRIKAWRNESNIGEYSNRNKVIENLAGKYLLFVDGDDVLYKHTLRNLKDFVEAFPEAGMIWGVSPIDVDYAVLPYMFSPRLMMKLIYENTRPYASIGFSETVFRVDCLRNENGFPIQYAIGDTYIKKKLSCNYPVLFVPMGFVFWRRSSTQASNLVSKNYRGFLESFQIDLEILEIAPVDHRDSLIKKVKGSFLRRLIGHSVMKVRFLLFFRLFSQSKLKFTDCRYIFKVFPKDFTPVSDSAYPLFNTFNF